MEFSQADRVGLLELARNTIASKLGILESHSSTLTEFTKSASTPCFVSIHLKTGALRGCIGTLESSNPLPENIKAYAERAAFEDPRFPPLTAREFPEILIGISVLGDLKPLTDFSKVLVGTHGLSVTHQKHRGVLLAKVATDFGWSRKQFMEHTCEKAGLNPKQLATYTWNYFEETSFEEPNV